MPKFNVEYDSNFDAQTALLNAAFHAAKLACSDNWEQLVNRVLAFLGFSPEEISAINIIHRGEVTLEDIMVLAHKRESKNSEKETPLMEIPDDKMKEILLTIHDRNLGVDVEKVVDTAPVALFDCFCGNSLDKKKESAKAIMNELIEERNKYTEGEFRTRKNSTIISVFRNNHNKTILWLPSKDSFNKLIAPCVGISSKSPNAYYNFKEMTKKQLPILRVKK